jgi:muconate cycloisomerase
MNRLITRARATPVSVPARPDSINSPGIVEADAAFAKRFRTGGSWSEFHLQAKWILELETAEGLVGIGETYRSVPPESARAALRSVLGKDPLALPWRRLPVEDPRAYDAIESAVLDLAGRLIGVPVHQLLGGAARDRIECNGWTGRRTPADAARKADEAARRGHRVFKFKCADGDPVAEWILAIRERCGESIRVLLDPNQRWRDVATTMRLMEGVPPGMMYGLEDPVERQDYAGFRELRERLDMPIFVHVSLPYRHQGQRPEDLVAALTERCADGFNLNGPMVEFVTLAAAAALDGKPCWHGSEVDLGILEASALHAAAAAPSCTIPCDIFGELVREDDLIVSPIAFEGPWALVPQGPGLGVELDREALARFACGEAIELTTRARAAEAR